MTLRDAGLIALGFVAGVLVASAAMASLAHDVEGTDRMIRALRLKYGSHLQGLG